MHRRFAGALACVAALVMAAPTWAVGESALDAAADVTVGDITQWDAAGSWISCDGEPSSQVCTDVHVAVRRVVDGHDELGTYMWVSQAVYTYEDGLLLTAEQWVGAGPAEFAVDRELNAAAASAMIEPSSCGEVESTDGPEAAPPLECPDVTHEISAVWTAIGEGVTTTERGSGYEGIYRSSGASSILERPAVATGTIGGGELGDSGEALLRERRWRFVSRVRHGGENGLGEPFREPWFEPALSTGTQLTAAWDSCAEDPVPGDVCIATVITAHGPNIHGDPDRVYVRREIIEVGEDGENRSIAEWEGQGPAEVSLDASSRTAAVRGVVEASECVPTGEPPPDVPPPLDGPPPPVPSECHIVSHEISANWTATDKATRRGSSTRSEATDWRTTRISERQFAATATATIDGEALGASYFALIQDATYPTPEPSFDWLWANNPDARTAVYAQWNTCGDEPPGPGDMCTLTVLTAYGFGPTAAEAELRFEQITYGEDVVFCVVSPTSPRLASAELTVDSSLGTASLQATVDVDECFPPQPGATDWDCRVVESQISIEWTAIEPAVQTDDGRVRLAAGTGTMTGTDNPDDLGEIETFGLIARRGGTQSSRQDSGP